MCGWLYYHGLIVEININDLIRIVDILESICLICNSSFLEMPRCYSCCSGVTFDLFYSKYAIITHEQVSPYCLLLFNILLHICPPVITELQFMLLKVEGHEYEPQSYTVAPAAAGYYAIQVFIYVNFMINKHDWDGGHLFVSDTQILILLWMLRFQILDQEGATFPMLVRYVATTLQPNRRVEIWYNLYKIDWGL